ncbi:hypothetical protein Aiant_75310 [Actinoplanes ianthinogenes]|uniref:Streptomycin 6-kinase n=1 Tax=Actinoplanes ianthinogenes TaxID=122358 RepID=A0ABM7M5H2_9ACTN|nr:hypothetical protein Aiant_75310 [Actinoplanes ianthinogenes]
MVAVPASFAQWRARLDGDAGRAWVASLPDRVERLAALWDLRLDESPPLHGAQALVVLVSQRDRELVLKLSAPQDPTTELEAAGLRAWAGRGVVELVASEPGALLLERLDPARTLRTRPIWVAAEVAGGLIRTLAVAAPAGLPRAGGRDRGDAAGAAGEVRRPAGFPGFTVRRGAARTGRAGAGPRGSALRQHSRRAASSMVGHRSAAGAGCAGTCRSGIDVEPCRRPLVGC